MAEKKYQQKKIQDTQGSGFGSYYEDTGGGKPFNTSNTRTTKENGKYRKANNKTMQARTADGKFTYKSVNGDSIDPKYGPSRGKTVNPLLTGGKNGVKIEDVEKQFASESGGYWDKYKDKWYRKGGQAVVNGLKVKVAGKAIWDVAKERYDKVKGEFEGESKVFDKSKAGRTSQDAKAAQQKAKSTGESQYVLAQNSGGIKGGQKELQENVNAALANAVNKPYQKLASAPASPAVQQTNQTNVVPQSEPSPAVVAKPTLKHSEQELENLRAQLMGSDKVSDKNKAAVQKMTIAQLDRIWDKLVK